MTNLEWTKSFEEFMKKIREEAQTPGTSVGVAKDGELVYHQGFGYRDVEKKAGITPDTVFGTASVGKSATCVAIMKLQEAGKLSVHDPVVKYIPEFRLKDNKPVEDMTIHHFMTHSSGLPVLPALGYAMKRSMLGDPSANDIAYDIEDHDPIDTFEELIEYMASIDFELLGPPGTQICYSNDAYALLGLIIERVSGQTYEQYVKEQILKPAGMEHSVFFLEELGDYDDITTLYSSRIKDGSEEVYAAPIWWDAPAMRASGEMKSTVRDMLKFTEIFRTGGLVGEERILSAESVEQMTFPHVQLNPNQSYGYGLVINKNYHGLTLIEHSGGMKGVAAEMFIAKEIGITGMIINNILGAPAPKMMSGLLSSIQSLPADTPPYSYSDYDVPAVRLPEYAGEYKSDAGMGMSVELENGELLLFLDQSTSVPMRAVENDGFAVMYSGTEALIRFTRDSEGNVTYMSIGGVITIPKVKVD